MSRPGCDRTLQRHEVIYVREGKMYCLFAFTIIFVLVMFYCSYTTQQTNHLPSTPVNITESSVASSEMKEEFEALKNEHWVLKAELDGLAAAMDRLNDQVRKALRKASKTGPRHVENEMDELMRLYRQMRVEDKVEDGL